MGLAIHNKQDLFVFAVDKCVYSSCHMRICGDTHVLWAHLTLSLSAPRGEKERERETSNARENSRYMGRGRRV